MDVGVAFLPDRVADPAALAGEVLLTGLFGRATVHSDDEDVEEDEEDEVEAERDGQETAEGPRTVYEIGEGVEAAAGGSSDGPAPAAAAGRKTAVVALPVPARGIAFQLWPSALALCRYLEDAVRKRDIALGSLRCLELGAGLGTVGIAAALLGVRKVYVTDLLPVCAHMEANILANPGCLDGAPPLDGSDGAATGSPPSAVALPPSPADRYGVAWAVAQEARTVPLALPWGADGTSVVAALQGHVDLVLASDVVYWEHLHAPLLETLRQLTDEPASAPPIVMAHLRRRRADKHFFRAAARWFTVTVVAQQAVPTYRSYIQIYRFVRRPPGPPARRSKR